MLELYLRKKGSVGILPPPDSPGQTSVFLQLQSLTLQIYCGFVPVSPQLLPTQSRTITKWLILVCRVAVDGEGKNTSVSTERKETPLLSLLSRGVSLGNKPHKNCILFIRLQSSDHITTKTAEEQEAGTFSVSGLTVVWESEGHIVKVSITEEGEAFKRYLCF